MVMVRCGCFSHVYGMVAHPVVNIREVEVLFGREEMCWGVRVPHRPVSDRSIGALAGDLSVNIKLDADVHPVACHSFP